MFNAYTNESITVMIIIYKLPTMFLVLFRIGLPQCTLTFLHISALQNKTICTAPLCSAYLGVQVVRILVEVPHPRVVGVGDLVALYPVFPPGVTPTFVTTPVISVGGPTSICSHCDSGRKTDTYVLNNRRGR